MKEDRCAMAIQSQAGPPLQGEDGALKRTLRRGRPEAGGFAYCEEKTGKACLAPTRGGGWHIESLCHCDGVRRTWRHNRGRLCYPEDGALTRTRKERTTGWKPVLQEGTVPMYIGMPLRRAVAGSVIGRGRRRRLLVGIPFLWRGGRGSRRPVTGCR
jgi:hypothetical protein